MTTLVVNSGSKVRIVSASGTAPKVLVATSTGRITKVELHAA